MRPGLLFLNPSPPAWCNNKGAPPGWFIKWFAEIIPLLSDSLGPARADHSVSGSPPGRSLGQSLSGVMLRPAAGLPPLFALCLVCAPVRASHAGGPGGGLTRPPGPRVCAIKPKRDGRARVVVHVGGRPPVGHLAGRALCGLAHRISYIGRARPVTGGNWVTHFLTVPPPHPAGPPPGTTAELHTRPPPASPYSPIPTGSSPRKAVWPFQIQNHKTARVRFPRVALLEEVAQRRQALPLSGQNRHTARGLPPA